MTSFVSLGFSPLDLRSDGPPSSGVRSMGARARVIRAFDDPSGSGVSGW